MISVVGEINDEQEELEQKLTEYKKYVSEDDEDIYDSLVDNYQTMKYELGNLMAYSALGKNEEAYAIANGAVNDSSTAIQKDIGVLSEHANESAANARQRLSKVYFSSLVSNGIVIVVSVILIIVAIYCVMKYIIKPITDIHAVINRRLFIVELLRNHIGNHSQIFMLYNEVSFNALPHTMISILS